MVRAISQSHMLILSGILPGAFCSVEKDTTLDMDAIIDAAAEHGVCIEINAHPSRLDLDWRCRVERVIKASRYRLIPMLMHLRDLMIYGMV